MLTDKYYEIRIQCCGHFERTFNVTATHKWLAEHRAKVMYLEMLKGMINTETEEIGEKII